MRIALRSTLATMLTFAAMTTALATASADQLAFDEAEYEIVWHRLTSVWAGDTTECDVTMSGSFHSLTIDKVEGELVGHVTHGSVDNCELGASATILTADLPWHVRYYEFEGTLPDITGLTLGIVGVAIRIDPADFPPCLIQTEAEEPFVGTADLDEEGTVTGFTVDPTAQIDPDRGTPCEIAGDIRFTGRGAVTPPGGGELSVILV